MWTRIVADVGVDNDVRFRIRTGLIPVGDETETFCNREFIHDVRQQTSNSREQILIEDCGV
jgi:hypothetical protein